MARLSNLWSGVVLAALLLAQTGCASEPAPTEAPPPAATGAPIDYSREAFETGEPESKILPEKVTAIAVVTRVGSVAVDVGPDHRVHLEITRLTRAGLSAAGKRMAERVTITPLVAEGTLTLEAETPEPLSSYAEVADFDLRIRVPASWARESEGEDAPALPTITLEGASGKVSVAGVRCALRIKTISGLVELRGLGGEAKVSTTEGDLKAVGCALRSLNVNSSGGNLTVEPARLGPGDELTLSSSIGSLKLVAPADADCRVEADTTGGRVSTNSDALRRGLRYSGRSLRSSLGEGAGLAQLRATTGNIQIDVKTEERQEDSREDGAT